MELFSPQHLIVLGATAAACVGLGLAARRDPGAAWITPVARGLAVLLVLNEIAFHVVLHLDEGLSARGDLPLHLTDAATIAAVIALWRPSALAFELTYFWAMTATVQALLTPDLRRGFPDYRWWWFFVAHAGVVIAAVFLAWGRRRTPRPGAVPRVYAWSLGVTALAAIGTVAFDGNYMFLRRPPGPEQPDRPAGSMALVHRLRGGARARPLLAPGPPLRRAPGTAWRDGHP